MKALCIARSKLKELRRHFGEYLVPIVFPVVFITTFRLAFSSTGGPMGVPYFDYLAPGMVVFALLMLAVNVSASLAREVDKGTLSRLRQTPMTSFDLLFGVFVMWALVAVVQVALLFGTALALGVDWQGGVRGLAGAMGIGVLAGLASIALGLLIAAFATTEGIAGGISTLITVPLAFVVGVFMPMPTEWAASLLPWGQAIRCIRAILNAGVSVSSLLPGILLMVLQIAVLLALSMIVYSRARLRRE